MKKKFPVMIFAGVLTIALLATVSYATGSTEAPGKDPLNLTPGTIVSNVFFKDRSLSGLTVEEAEKVVNAPFENIKKKTFVVRSEDDPSLSFAATFRDLGITFDTKRLSAFLKENELSGNVLARYKKAKDIQASPLTIPVEADINESAVTNYFSNSIAAWKQEPADASISFLTGEKVITPAKNGRTYDLTAGIKKLCEDVRSLNIDQQNEYGIDPGESITEPQLTTDRVEAMEIIGSFSTEFFKPDDQRSINRRENLINSVKNLTGRRFAPGEVVSALDLYGPVTAENGYKEAGTFNEGTHSVEMGGGICQTTTTLYGAVRLAELDIKFRNHHSMMVTYVDPGLDAMVYYQGNQDFQFINSSSDYIFIEGLCGYDNETITIYIIGHEDHAPDHSVRYESEVLSLAMPDIKIVEDPTIPIGLGASSTKFALMDADGPIPTVEARVWKITTDGGVETRELYTPTDKYRGCGASYKVSSDIELEFSFGGPRVSGYLIISPQYLNGFHLSTNPYAMTDDEIIAFNESMQKCMEEKGMDWPNKGTSRSIKDPNPDPPEEETTAEPEEESKKASLQDVLKELLKH